MNQTIKNIIKNLGIQRDILYSHIDDVMDENIFEILETISKEKSTKDNVRIFEDEESGNDVIYVEIDFGCTFTVHTKELGEIPVSHIYMSKQPNSNTVRFMSPVSEDIDFDEIDSISKLIIVEYIMKMFNL